MDNHKLTTEQVRKVCDALEVGGWKEGQVCLEERVHGTNSCCGGHEWSPEHFTDPPDIFSPAGAWALLVALWKRGYDVEIMQSVIQIWDRRNPADCEERSELLCEVMIRGKDSSSALLDAAYQLAAKEQR